MHRRRALCHLPDFEVRRLANITVRRKLIIPWCVCLAFFLAQSPRLRARGTRPGGNTREFNLDAYEAELARDSTLIDRIKNQPVEIWRFRNSLPSDWIVRVNGAEFRVPTQALVSALTNLEAHPKNAVPLARDIEFRLVEMRQSAIELGASSGEVSASAARVQLQKVFQRREFEGLKGPTRLQLLEARIERWIALQIMRLLKLLHMNAKTGNLLAWIVIALAFLGIAYWVFRVISRRVPMNELPSSAPAAPSDSRSWAGDALAAAERGDYREAVHCAYWAAIARLEDLRLLTRDRSRTPRESLRLLDLHPNEQTPLRDLTRHFELIWYGYRPASPSDWSVAKAQLEIFGCLKASTAATANS